MRIMIIGLAVLTVLFSNAPASAQTSANFGGPNGGSVIPGWDSRACGGGGSPGGAIRYNSASSCTEYCDGTDWVCPSSSASSGPSGCVNVGDECDDGTIFAGLSPDGYEAMYTTPSDAGGIPWNNGNTSGYVNLYTPTTESTTGGEASTAAFIGVDSDSDTGGVQPFQAPEYCYNLDVHGHQDWYVPARDEFFILHDNQADIGGFVSTYYWTATEVATDAMIFVNNTDRSTGSGVKRFANEVRCVRKGAPPWGLSGPSGCPNIGDQCADNTVFAGWDPIRHEHLFIPTTDQEQPGSPGTFTMNWKNETETNDINPDSISDGEANHTNRSGSIGNFQAFQACEDLGFGSHNDWYLPSQVELYYLWAVHETIEAGGNITNFQNAIYWSSTEYDTFTAWLQFFDYGTQTNFNKTNEYRLRCVRR